MRKPASNSPVFRLLKHGFTLIEMLIVIVVIGLLIVLATPALNGTMQGNRLSSAGQNLLGRLSEAQQMCSALNKTVEVRFYNYTNPDNPSLGDQFYSYQFFVLETKTSATGAVTEELRILSSPYEVGITTLICSAQIDSKEASPLLPISKLVPDGTGSAESPKYFKKASAKYVALRFSPDGKVRRISTNQTATGNVFVQEELSLPDAYLTVVPDNKASGGTVPNFFSVQIDPYGGHARFYQPVP